MDAISLYNQTTLECSKLITERYSTSFTLGIKTLDKSLHLPIYAIYGFVRYADEIVDTFHDQDKQGFVGEILDPVAIEVDAAGLLKVTENKKDND